MTKFDPPAVVFVEHSEYTDGLNKEDHIPVPGESIKLFRYDLVDSFFVATSKSGVTKEFTSEALANRWAKSS